MSENDKEYRDGVLLNDKAPEFRRDCRRAVQERLDDREEAGRNGSRGETYVQFMQRMKLGPK